MRQAAFEHKPGAHISAPHTSADFTTVQTHPAPSNTAKLPAVEPYHSLGQ